MEWRIDLQTLNSYNVLDTLGNLQKLKLDFVWMLIKRVHIKLDLF